MFHYSTLVCVHSFWQIRRGAVLPPNGRFAPGYPIYACVHDTVCVAFCVRARERACVWSMKNRTWDYVEVDAG